jgi:hypothetical protein
VRLTRFFLRESNFAFLNRWLSEGKPSVLSLRSTPE